jgi:hypothetical protein
VLPRQNLQGANLAGNGKRIIKLKRALSGSDQARIAAAEKGFQKSCQLALFICSWNIYRYKVFVADCTKIDMPDTLGNRKAYPSRQEKVKTIFWSIEKVNTRLST